MYDPNDPQLPPEMRERLDPPYGPDAKGSDLIRSVFVLGIIAAAVLTGLWYAGF